MRNIPIDIAKGIGIISVILVHTSFLPFQYQLLPIITPWMLAIFLVTSGTLAYTAQPTASEEKRSFIYGFKRKVQSVIFPYFLFGFTSYVVWLQLRWYDPQGVIFDSWENQLKHFITGRGLTFNGPLWFLPPFFISSMFFFSMKKFILHLPLAVLAGLSICFAYLAVLANPQKTTLIYSYDLALLFISFLLMGVFASKAQKILSKKKILIPLLLLFFTVCSVNGTVDLFQRLYNSWFLFWLSASLGSILIFFGSEYFYLKSNKAAGHVANIGKKSLLLLCTHWPVMQWLTFILWKTGMLSKLNGTPQYAAFSYYHPNKYIFTLIELPLLAFYTTVPILLVMFGIALKNVFVTKKITQKALRAEKRL